MPPLSPRDREDTLREAERARQREIVEKLKVDKLELDEAEARRGARGWAGRGAAGRRVGAARWRCARRWQPERGAAEERANLSRA